MYRENDIRQIAQLRADVDAEHTAVYWKCHMCGHEDTTDVSMKINSRVCKCRRWMKWSYYPFSEQTMIS